MRPSYPQILQTEDGQPLIKLFGDLCATNARMIEDAVRTAEWLPGEVVILNCEKVTFLDSSGISALVRAAKRLRKEQRFLRLQHLSRTVLTFLDQSSFAPLFLIDREVEVLPPPFGPLHR